MKSLIELNARSLLAARADRYAGYDPFDSLNSRLLQKVPVVRGAWSRLLWLQLGKRSPVNLRPLLGVPKMRNPKGVGLFIAGLIQDYRRTGLMHYLREAQELANWLLDARSDQALWGHSCWGYHFDWQARAFYVPAGKPNVITTCYVARALYELGELTDNTRLIEAAMDAARFIARHLFIEGDSNPFIAYIPGENVLVHNASLWGAAWCGFVASKTGDSAMLEQALQVARRSAQDQGADGSWVYGERPHHQFIDSFHTGYNLEALSILRDAAATDEFDNCIDSGYRYYISNFFEKDGTAKYYDRSTYPIDPHCFAQAVFTLLKVGGRVEDLALCDRVVHRAIKTLYLPRRSRFAYQRGRLWTNRINYSRWTQAWAYYALAYYNHHRPRLARIDSNQPLGLSRSTMLSLACQ